MKDLLESESNMIVHFPIKKSETNMCKSEFVKIHINSPFTNIGSFSILKNTSESTDNKNQRNLYIVINRNSISLDMEILIAGKLFCKFQSNEIAQFFNKEHYYFNELTLQELNFDINYSKVKKGKYPISITEDKIKIHFTLTK